MASAVTVVARQTGFATGVAARCALTPPDLVAAGVVRPFSFAAAASVARPLLPAPAKI